MPRTPLTCARRLAGSPMQPHVAHLNCQHRPVLVSCRACRSRTAARLARACSTAAEGACRWVHDFLHNDALLGGCTDSGAQAAAGVACVNATHKHVQQSESCNRGSLGPAGPYECSAVQYSTVQYRRLLASHPWLHVRPVNASSNTLCWRGFCKTAWVCKAAAVHGCRPPVKPYVARSRRVSRPIELTVKPRPCSTEAKPALTCMCRTDRSKRAAARASILHQRLAAPPCGCCCACGVVCARTRVAAAVPEPTPSAPRHQTLPGTTWPWGAAGGRPLPWLHSAVGRRRGRTARLLFGCAGTQGR